MENSEADNAVFYPTVKRTKCRSENNLYDLVNIVPAKPIITKDDAIKGLCDFHPRTDKYYIPKRKSTRLKVKTVRDIRKLFEEDIITSLPRELEQQQNSLLKKIRRGSSKEESTKLLAKNIFKSDTPISRSTWQMLVNLNPEQFSNRKQYVIWNGQHIQVNGSKGGNEKYICHFDLAHSNMQLRKRIAFKQKVGYKKKGLLRNSLAIKFKPGPLGRKKFLDDSHQKFHVGESELVKLPELGLDVFPAFGTSLEPTIIHFLNNLRNEDGTITQKWAELAVSVLGKIKKSNAVLINNDCVTFNLNYKCDQHRLLMRRDINTCDNPIYVSKETLSSNLANYEDIVLPEVKDMMSKILDCVEMSLNQDNMYTGEDVLETDICVDIKEDLTRDKHKRKYCELDRLDVTVIRLPGESKNEANETCNKTFCRLGCVCDSLDSTFRLRGHCGLTDCMFQCKCEYSKYPATFDLESSELPQEFLSFNRGINLNLAKEEKKFHQTVIFSGDKSILLKSHKRNAKVPKRYTDFYKPLSSKNEFSLKQTLSVIVFKLNCDNIEPWCMVHKLYKCFCKGKFIEACSSAGGDNNIANLKTLNTASNDTIADGRVTKRSIALTSTPDNETNADYFEPCLDSYSISTCARVNAYTGRKYTDGYYKNTHEKISEMEKNDSKLRRKMISLVYKNISKDDEILGKDLESQSPCTSTSLNQFLSGVDELIMSEPTDDNVITLPKSKILPNKTKLVAWLESNYKMYKERIDRGITKISLDPPKSGKVALYPWSFILSRYRERKNFFLISKQKPFRIFMAVNKKNPIFGNCMNINDIGFAELHKYPLTVKNLLTNATDLKDNFCILCGLSECWELIGSVNKINEAQQAAMAHKDSSDTDSVDPFDMNSTWDDQSSLESRLDIKEDSFQIMDDSSSENTGGNVGQNIELSKQPDESSSISDQQEKESNPVPSNDAEISKWFVLTVENDFTEIRFYKRGFFVTYESIVKAINVARTSQKTVRLSSVKCGEKCSGPQFGMYAIPNTNEYCVFIGPYEIDDSIGIETIKTIYNVGKTKRTRGFWIMTNKIDNENVINNPLSFMKTAKKGQSVPLDFPFESSDDIGLGCQEEEMQNPEEVNKSVPSTSKSPIKKIVKPITIRKTNGFYHLDSNGLLKENVITRDEKTKSPAFIVPNKGNLDKSMIGSLLKLTNVAPYKIIPKSIQSPTVSPIKITAVYSTAKKDNESIKSGKTEKGMFILKPEEINRKILESSSSKIDYNSLSLDKKPETDTEMEKLETNDDNDDVYVISDEEDCENKNEEDCTNEQVIVNGYKEVWIQSSNGNLGWIRGRKNSVGHLSFKIPGCPYSEFYSPEVVFYEINQSISTKVDLTEENLAWKVTESQEDLDGNEISLDSEELRPSNAKTYFRTRRKPIDVASEESDSLKAGSTCKSMKPEDLPFQGSTANSEELLNSIQNAPDTLKLVMTETLKSILSMAQELDE